MRAYNLFMSTLDPNQLASALGDRHRRLILAMLADAESLCVCELVDALGVPQARVSQHLARLRAAGLVEHERVANRHHYRLAPGLPLWACTVLRGYAEAKEALPCTT